MDSTLALIKEYLPIPYFGFEQFAKLVHERNEKLQDSDASDYMSFRILLGTSSWSLRNDARPMGSNSSSLIFRTLAR
jgi:hypothetical protein